MRRSFFFFSERIDLSIDLGMQPGRTNAMQFGM